MVTKVNGEWTFCEECRKALLKKGADRYDIRRWEEDISSELYWIKTDRSEVYKTEEKYLEEMAALKSLQKTVSSGLDGKGN